MPRKVIFALPLKILTSRLNEIVLLKHVFVLVLLFVSNTVTDVAQSTVWKSSDSVILIFSRENPHQFLRLSC